MKLNSKDIVDLRNHVDIAIKAALITYMEERYKMQVVVKVNSSQVMHTALQPEGDTFGLGAVVEVHEKTIPPE